MSEFERRIGRRTLGNKAASGTEIIQELGAEHMRTGSPIVYTSADSVFQVAAHEEVIPLWELYKICETAREILRGPHEVGRVIARPFIGAPGNFTRTANRHDYAVPPPQGMLLDQLDERGVAVHSVGKIFDVFLGRGIRESAKTKNNADGMAKTLEAMEPLDAGLIFVNLVDFDQQYGHRNDVEGYGAALEQFDAWLPQFESALARRRPGHFHRRPRLRPHHARHRPQPRVRSAAGLRAAGARTAWTWGCAPRFRISARPWPPISARASRKAPVSYRKSYEKTSHGGQLEDVQDARGNHRILREVPAAGREIRALRDRDLSSFHEPRRGRRCRQGHAHPHRRAEHRLGQGRRVHRRNFRADDPRRGRHPRHRRATASGASISARPTRPC